MQEEPCPQSGGSPCSAGSVWEELGCLLCSGLVRGTPAQGQPGPGDHLGLCPMARKKSCPGGRWQALGGIQGRSGKVRPGTGTADSPKSCPTSRCVSCTWQPARGPHGTAAAVRLKPQPRALTPTRAEGFVRGCGVPAGLGVWPTKTPPSGTGQPHGGQGSALTRLPSPAPGSFSQRGGLPTWCPPLCRWLWPGRAGSWCGRGCHQLTPSRSSLSTPTSAAGTELGIALPMGGSWGAPLCGSGAVLPAGPARPADGACCPLSWPAPRPACCGPSSAAPAAPAGGHSPGRGWCSWMGRDAVA